MTDETTGASAWPPLPYDEWRDTRDTLHMYTQVVGKLRLALSPFEPEWANVPLYVTARGLSTSTIASGLRSIDVELDLIDHVLVMRSSDGRVDRRPLGGSVASLYDDFLRMLGRMSVDVQLSVVPSEVAEPIPFPDDHVHDTYDADQAHRFFVILSMIDGIMKEYRAGFRGRSTLSQFFWGTFDLAVTRYSGRQVSPPAGAGLITRFTADAEAICSGWWPGNDTVRHPAFFAYGYPAPRGIERATVDPGSAGWDSDIREFLLSYDAARAAPDPRQDVLRFLNSTYTAAAELMGWDAELTNITRPGGAQQRVSSGRDA